MYNFTPWKWNIDQTRSVLLKEQCLFWSPLFLIFCFFFWAFFSSSSSVNTSSHTLRLPVLKSNAKTQIHWLSTNQWIPTRMRLTDTQLSGNTFNQDEILRKLAYYYRLTFFCLFFVFFFFYFFLIFFLLPLTLLHMH